MKLYTFEVENRSRIGAELRGSIVDLRAAHQCLLTSRSAESSVRSRMPGDMLSFLRGGGPCLEMAREALAFMARRPAVPVDQRLSYAFEEVKLKAPISNPGKILCIGLNYQGRIEESGADRPVGLPPFFA